MATRDSDPYTLLAGADLTGKDGSFGKQSAGKVILCSVLGERADCIIGSEGVAGAAIDCYPRAGKKVIVKIGAVAVAIDAEITTDALGLAKTAVSTNIVRCRALSAGNPGESIEMHWVDAYAKP